LARTTSTDYTVTSFLFHTPEISIAQAKMYTTPQALKYGKGCFARHDKKQGLPIIVLVQKANVMISCG
ncbi:hypothetical protein, partial [Vibrio mediterranei]|uniref:hypothetical protein n=1 Tax=Vibrio mediterranei TaxID=689 RepID=UPI004068012C